MRASGISGASPPLAARRFGRLRRQEICPVLVRSNLLPTPRSSLTVGSQSSSPKEVKKNNMDDLSNWDLASNTTSLSPLDGRYMQKVKDLRPFFSEYGLIRYRVLVEVKWLQKLSQIPEIVEVPQFSQDAHLFLEKIIDNFDINDAVEVKKIEKITNHDVKAVEYYLKQKCKSHPEIAKVLEFFHFACTSEDINNLAHALSLKEALNDVIFPAMVDLCKEICALAKENAHIPMLSRTHGQPASPTTLGKEMANFAVRLGERGKTFSRIQILGKFAGAVGNYNAHKVAYPNINWRDIAAEFVPSLGVDFNAYVTQVFLLFERFWRCLAIYFSLPMQIEPHDYIPKLFNNILQFNNVLTDFDRDIWSFSFNFTSKNHCACSQWSRSAFQVFFIIFSLPMQIEPHDYIAELFNNILQFNNILTDFDRDIWSYISLGYFKQITKAGEIGSSTMPHKVNPIDFENSEGNLCLANAILSALSMKLPVSRMQRDLTDSTVLRNLGVGLGYSLVAYKSALQGIKKLQVNESRLIEDLEQTWEVLAEPIQTVMRRHAVPEAYEKLKELTRGREVSKQSIREFTETLDLPEEAKAILLNLTPNSYIGEAEELAKSVDEAVDLVNGFKLH
ncbi:hypothetical protein ZIOFF_025475 [Zingiber officinale]|uniref:Adenylosuccinate lyase n=1 Tax=Zingiber officinale TaxID=94328 RepID=A0A8J5HEQ5_ZINOF|nr:hypothetical protein ZIOFF_025475 [Zingiber officinale]